MKEVNLNPKYYLIETMGCQMNERDSETLAGMAEEFGYVRVPERGATSGSKAGRIAGATDAAASAETSEARAARARLAADIIIVNTCSVRENADNRFFGALGRIKKAKESDPNKIVAVCGCMTQQPHVVERIQRKFPWVDILFGATNIEDFPALLADAVEKRERRAYEALSQPRHRTLVRVGADGSVVEGLPARRKHPYKAFVNITYGCDNFCTYCIVPYTRGRERSRTPEAILDETRALAADGVKEITLLGQNVNSYSGSHKDGGNGSTDFPTLIRLLDDIPGIERIRFMTSHPKDLSDGLIDCYRTAEHLCPSIHLPVQSGGTEVLRRMNRGYTKGFYLSLIDKLRGARPDIVITTDFIVGFPGETDDDFEDTMDVVERARFDAAFTFLYSPRKGTPAASYEGRVPDDVAHARFDRMVKRLNEISLEKNRSLLGGVYDVL
ncbi:MAG: tRNA (N6-isopentenyl adenosine(37)-C2)-methylthiotransferase MiaB, partial [Clostridiales Family XIII bacterium]|nr:tRNA (N6-isopentenyl adenosine(37)-C2)-methylthiotransferase MiaB [Clostridiales Family XIII bacterium]